MDVLTHFPRLIIGELFGECTDVLFAAGGGGGAFRRQRRLEIRFVLKTAELHERIGDTVFGVFLRGYQKQGLPTRHNGVEMIAVHQMND